MTLRYLFCFLIFSMCVACGSKPSETEDEITTIEDLGLDELDATPSAVDSSATAGIENAPSPPPMTEEDKKAAEKIKEKRKEIVQEQLHNSPFKNCDDALAKYKELTEAYLTGKNRWKDWDANDVVYNSCKNKGDYKPQYDALQAKMDEYDDE